MNEQALCILYTQDEQLSQRVKVYIPHTIDLKHVESSGQLLLALEQHGPSVVLLDVRGTNTLDLLRDVGKRWPENVIVAMGAPRSDPLMEALDVGVYSAQDLEFDGPAFETLVRQAAHHLNLTDEVQMLREQLDHQQHNGVTPTGGEPWRVPTLQMRQFFQPLRHFDNVAGVLQGMVDGIANEAGVLRVGIFAGTRMDSDYSLMAGMGCLDDTRELTVRRDDSLVRWLEVNAHVVTRTILGKVQSLRERKLLQRALDAMGAELIIPLHGRTHMLGWLFLGKRATGLPFEDASLQTLIMFAEHASTALENAMLYQEITLQKSFAETLLHSLPTGIIAAGEDEQVRWFNDSAERILNIDRRNVMQRSIDALGNPVAERLRLALRGRVRQDELHEWEDAHASRFLSLRTARLISGDRCWGAVAFVHDMTRERLLNRKQKELDQAAFWTELAAGMSHEIRNPLVAIKTFAQLLPERYNEPDFRSQFSSLMTQEVDRLDSVIQEINRFANLPKPDLQRILLKEAIEHGIQEATLRLATHTVSIKIDLPGEFPSVRGDKQALSECFAHLFTNAMESLQNRPNPTIVVKGSTLEANGDGEELIEIIVDDNGCGIPSEIRGNVFSPFCTTKTRAMGLGLPIVQRTVSEHNGRVEVESNNKGTSVRIVLPVERVLEKQPV